MTIYRVKQFIWAIIAMFKPIDQELIKQYLNKEEENLFNKLNKSEKYHSIRVCKDALSIYNNSIIDRKKLAKIALLHDVGKISTNLNVIDKSLIVILDKVTKGNLKRFNSNIKIDTYYNHPKKSVDLLNSIDKYDTEFLDAIEMHHYKTVSSNEYLKIIKECDNNN